MAGMLTATLMLLMSGAPEDAWIERLEFPRLAQTDLNLVIHEADLGITGYDLGFPDDPQVRFEEAYARLEEGDRSASTLHQAASGLASLRDADKFRKVMPACLSVYVEELKAAPDEVSLRWDFARALVLAGTTARKDRFLRDADVQLAKVAQGDPGNWRVLDEQAMVLVARALLSPTEGAAPVWLSRAIELADEAIALAPRETAPRWRRFYASYTALVHGGITPELGLFIEMAGLADTLVSGAAEAEEPRLVLAGEAYWFLASLAPVVARFDGRELPTPASAEHLLARLTAFRDPLEAAPASELRTDAARAWWMLTAFSGEQARWREDMQLAVQMGVPAGEAHILALMGLHKRGVEGAAAEVAEVLAKGDESDDLWRILTIYRHEIGDDAGALEAQARIGQADPILRLARAQLRLRTGDNETARDELKVLVGQAGGTLLAGPASHAYGVALALTGDVPGAKLQLSVAARLMGEEDGAGARATLDELR
jgi:hypothetical protein